MHRAKTIKYDNKMSLFAGGSLQFKRKHPLDSCIYHALDETLLNSLLFRPSRECESIF